MKNWRVLGIGCVCLLCSVLVSQESHEPETLTTSGNEFLRECSEEQPIDHMACVAFVAGVVQGVGIEIGYVSGLSGKDMPAPFCEPKELENGQALRITLKYINAHPEKAHQTTAVLIAWALREAFPCPKQRKHP